MAVKSGTSHALSTFLLTISSAILVQYLKETAFFETVFKINGYIADFIRFWIALITPFDVPLQYLEFTTIAVMLSFFWGMSYHYLRHGSG